MNSYFTLIKLCIIGGLMVSCTSKNNDYTINVYQTSQAGDNLKLITNAATKPTHSNAKKLSLKINTDIKHQEYVGFGASFTESSAWNLATIAETKRIEVLTRLFSPTNGAGFSLTRTHINSSDYSNGHYTYVDSGDVSLSTFSVNEDMKGFTGQENDQVRGVELIRPDYDLIPMILEAQNIEGADFKIIASPWSPPSWMKTGETSEMTNGTLMPKYYGVWAKYLSMFVSAYAKQGIKLWGITPQNEPLHAHDARWDSNGLTPEQGRVFLQDYLGPQLVKDGHLKLNDLEAGLRVIIYDHNKSSMLNYVSATYNDPEAAKYAWGTGFHWYANSELDENGWFAKELDSLRLTWPTKGMIHTESSIDIDAKDPVGQYWRESTDYAGTFVPFETYVYDIITDMNHGAQGYIEWCMILSHKGQPNPYNNFNSAPILINPDTYEIIYTPLYYLLSHFSKFIRPGAQRIELTGNKHNGIIYTAAINPNGTIAVVIFNNTNEPVELDLNLKSNTTTVQLAPITLQTITFTKAQTTK
ncbi:MAG: glycoside hydrolase family 30 protein [Bacteroidia bacterium]